MLLSNWFNSSYIAIIQFGSNNISSIFLDSFWEKTFILCCTLGFTLYIRISNDLVYSVVYIPFSLMHYCFRSRIIFFLMYSSICCCPLRNSPLNWCFHWVESCWSLAYSIVLDFHSPSVLDLQCLSFFTSFSSSSDFSKPIWFSNMKY